MKDPRGRLEGARAAARMSQAAMGKILGVTQGPYSKVITGKVPLTEALRGRMDEWLETQPGPVGRGGVSVRMQELAASIRRECIELMHLAGLAGGLGEDGRPPRP